MSELSPIAPASRTALDDAGATSRATAADTPHPSVGDMQRQHLPVLDLDGCNVFAITMLVREHESASGHRFEQWPAEIQRLMTREVDAFMARGHAAIKAITQGVQDGMCVLCLHWKPKA